MLVARQMSRVPLLERAGDAGLLNDINFVWLRTGTCWSGNMIATPSEAGLRLQNVYENRNGGSPGAIVNCARSAAKGYLFRAKPRASARLQPWVVAKNPCYSETQVGGVQLWMIQPAMRAGKRLFGHAVRKTIKVVTARVEDPPEVFLSGGWELVLGVCLTQAFSMALGLLVFVTLLTVALKVVGLKVTSIAVGLERTVDGLGFEKATTVVLVSSLIYIVLGLFV